MHRRLDYRTVTLREDGRAIRIIDQTRLPQQVVFCDLETQEQIRHAIYTLQVRGAPAIGVTAAYGLALAAGEIDARDHDGFMGQLADKKAYLAAARPTAVNLFWALDEMEAFAAGLCYRDPKQMAADMLQRAREVEAQDVRVCRRIGENGLALLQDGWGILTHCNAGQLAAVLYGTALAPVYAGAERGYTFHMYCDETRPLLQGARLTAFEMRAAGIDTTLLCDNMAATAMARGDIQAVLVGADRIAANGDTANKIGTLGVAILAQYYGIPFYVCAPLSTFDPCCESGADITIEQRPGTEISEMWYKQSMAPAGVKFYNPAFDVTPAALITGIVSEYGVARAPYTHSIPALFAARKRQPV